MNDFTLQRVGAVLDIDAGVEWVRHIPVMEKMNILLYILWPNEDSWQGEYESIMAQYRPSKVWVRAAMQHPSNQEPPLLQISGDRPSTSTSFSLTSSAFEMTTNVTTPTRATTPDGSGQVIDDFEWEWDGYPTGGPSGLRRGETMAQFFARRKESNRAWLARASQEDLQAMASR